MTALFVLAHYGEIGLYWQGFFPLTVGALAMLWFRLASCAVGPAMTLHVTYNGFLALAVLAGFLLDTSTP